MKRSQEAVQEVSSSSTDDNCEYYVQLKKMKHDRDATTCDKELTEQIPECEDKNVSSSSSCSSSSFDTFSSSSSCSSLDETSTEDKKVKNNDDDDTIDNFIKNEVEGEDDEVDGKHSVRSSQSTRWQRPVKKCRCRSNRVLEEEDDDESWPIFSQGFF